MFVVIFSFSSFFVLRNVAFAIEHKNIKLRNKICKRFGADSCEFGNEYPDSVMCGEFLEYL
jgi:hypothetical protein